MSPSGASLDETISTLNFAQRAKLIKNIATVNEDTKDTIKSLQAEVERLTTLLHEQQAGSIVEKTFSDSEIEKTVAACKARADQADKEVEVLKIQLAESEDFVKLLDRRLKELSVRSINEKSRYEIASGGGKCPILSPLILSSLAYETAIISDQTLRLHLKYKNLTYRNKHLFYKRSLYCFYGR